MVHTNFHCKVLSLHTAPALDRLAQFFVSPQLDAAAVSAEVENVHSEYTRNCNRCAVGFTRSVCPLNNAKIAKTQKVSECLPVGGPSVKP